MNLAVIFDMDGVLVDSGPAHLDSWLRLAEEEGLPLSRDQFLESFGRPSREIIRSDFGENLTDADVKRLDDRKEALYRDIVTGNVPAMPGAVDLLNTLRAENIPLAVGTSGPPENVNLVLEELNLAHHFAAVVTGTDVTRGKPDPQVFLIAAQRLNIPPTRCIVIEDAPAGIQAANHAKMKAIALTSTHQASAFPTADKIIDNLSQIQPELLKSLI
jgi:beta-phosphoglucomutase